MCIIIFVILYELIWMRALVSYQELLRTIRLITCAFYGGNAHA